MKTPKELHRRRTGILAAAAGLALVASNPAMADPVETIVIADYRLPEAVGEPAFSSVLLSGVDLTNFAQLDRALEQVPGLSLFRRTSSLSANPTTQGVSLRAIAPSAAGRALVLLDGVPLNDPFGGWVIWSAVPTEDIETAQIIRGAGSGPYGAGALTGTILLSEQDKLNNQARADVSAGSLDTLRVGGVVDARVDNVDLLASGTAEHSNGWMPVEPSARGPADNNVRFNALSGSIRASADLGGDVTASARLGYYDDLQNAGLVGAEARARGETASITLARAENVADAGWRVQGWLIDSGLSNSSVSTTAHQASTTPANDQYATPALGWGINAAALSDNGTIRWEAGVDLRDNEGQSRELYGYSTGLKRFLDTRRAGGREIVTGAYAEAAYQTRRWLVTAGGRADYWATSQGHLVQSLLSSGAITLDRSFTARDGVVPTGRVGARYDLDDDRNFLRVAAYAGFRVPTLNELYRPFRVGNVVTNANAALSPEELDGVEAGAGGEFSVGTSEVNWNATAFWNVLHDAVENATVALANCPPGTGSCQRRENVGDIDAKGLEADVKENFGDVSLRQAVAWTDARVHPGLADLALSGKRPAQAPAATVTSGLEWTPIAALSLDADLRWVGAQYEDDLNATRLGSAFTLDVRVEWRIRGDLSLFGKVDNATDAKVATGNTTGVINIGAPRVFEIGLGYAD